MMIQNCSLCIHGHFYQPLREDPQTRLIPDEPGAAPYPNWNERILDTCYRPNVALRNFSRISFNLGPTLAKWMATAAPDVLHKIASEDKLNTTLYGAGNAMAQPYNHTILPLASLEDKRAQVHWGIRAFENLFGRYPQGMWLPETAADLQTLNVLADAHIRFIILAPWQVKDAKGDQPYRIDLGNGREIIAFIYNGSLSTTVSFDTFATSNADAFAEFYVKPEVQRQCPRPLLMIASDGELYGHHQPYRDKFLSRLVDGATSGIDLKVTFPELWLKENPVTGTARLAENTSWSCMHGIERWRNVCDCTPDSTWKAPLREGLDVIANAIDQAYKRMAQGLGLDPIDARNQYIDVVLGEMDLPAWLRKVSNRDYTREEISRIDNLMSAQYDRQQIYTSDGWFHDELSRIEPRNNLSYAARAISLMEMLTGDDLHTQALPILKKAVSSKTGETAADYFRDALRGFLAA